MKKFINKITVFLFCLLIPGLAWSEAVPLKEKKVLVVYYSRTGYTQQVAEKLAKKFNADLERLIDKKKRTGPVGFSGAGKDAVAGNLTKLEPLKHNLQEYDIILIGTPSWFGNVTPAVRTFIKENNLSGKKVGIFSVTHLTGVENALKQAAELISKENPEKVPALPLRHSDLNDSELMNAINSFYGKIFDK